MKTVANCARAFANEHRVAREADKVSETGQDAAVSAASVLFFGDELA